MDISAPSAISTQATLAAHNSVRDVPEVATVEPSGNLENTRNDTNTASGQNQSDTTEAFRSRRDHQSQVQDPDTQTGPPPTFQITLLEVEQDLQNILARLELTRSHERDANAVNPQQDDRTQRQSTQSSGRAPKENPEVQPQTPQISTSEAGKSEVFPI